MTMRTRWGCVALVAYPFVELAFAVALAEVIGWWWVLVYAVVCATLGLGLVRYALSASGRSLNVALTTLRQPGDASVPVIEDRSVRALGARRKATPPAQTLLIVPAGLLIAVPGIITTVVGLVLWLPPVRQRLAHRMQARIEGSVYRPDEGSPSG